MTRTVSRRFAITSLLIGGAGLTWAGPGLAFAPERSLRPVARGGDPAARSLGRAEALVAKYDLAGKVGFSVADVASGRVLEDLNPSAALPPASVTKTVTALYALDRLGAGHRFETRLLAAGPVRDGILHGDLILAGGGDPSLDTDALATLAARLKSAGLREVRGRFVVCDGALPYVRSIDPEQLPHVGYSPAVSGIALNYNRVHFEWKRNGAAYATTMDARTKRFRPDVTSARMSVADRKLPVYTYAERDGVDIWTVARGALGKGGARWLPVRNPAAYAGDVFRTLARSQGIVLKPAVVERTLPAGVATLATWQSQPLDEILRLMLKYSNNLTAEMVGLAASSVGGDMPQSLAASAARMNGWAAASLGMTRAALVDHSGLGAASRLSAGDLTRALVRVRHSGVLRPLLKRIPIRDAKGRPMTDHPVIVDAKTGTLFFVSCLAGFMTAADGTELAFTIFTADTEKRARAIATRDERPAGAKGWNGRSRRLQQALIARWGLLYGS
ncbi:MAG: D-alanyl-D-alanine carboxypeptidase/D-alanyl-D-alanine endopeptidase [Marinibacterium sp.]